MKNIALANAGSDRATAYNISNKLVRRGERLYVGWLDAPVEAGGPVRIQLGVCDGTTGVLERVIPLGEGVDNHCGLALALDGGGRLHALVGAHHGDFLYRYAYEPQDPAAWSEPEPIGPKHSYPALCVDAGGTLHLAYRERGERWQLQYTRKQPDGPWEPPVVIAESPTPGYNHFMHSLSLGPTGNLHLTFQFHYSASGNARECKGRALAYIHSTDGGASWSNEGEPCEFPLTIDSTQWIASCFESDHGIRAGTHVVDRHDRPWLYCAVPDPSRGLLWRRSDEGWRATDLKEVLPDLDFTLGKATAISYDAQDRVHLLASVHPDGVANGWYDIANEVFHVAFDLEGAVVACEQLSVTDPTRANWLPAIEHWDWTRADSVGQDGHWYLYTSGINAGLMSQADYDDALKTEVYLGRL